MKRILIIDDDKDWLGLAGRMLRQAGYDLDLLTNANTLTSKALAHLPDLVVTDIMMPGISGAQVVTLLRRQLGTEIPIIVCSSTKLRFKIEDAKLAYCGKFDAHTELVPLIDKLLHASQSDLEETDLTKDAGQRGEA
jgi:CheY-like chemotaxis protein